MLGTGIKHRNFFIYLLVLMLVVGTLPVSFAVTGGQDPSGLPECAEELSDDRIELNGNYDIGDVITSGAITITVTDVKVEDGKSEVMEISWESDGEPIVAVFMKAGSDDDDSNLYVYNPMVYSDSGVVVGGKKGLSHVRFYVCHPGELTVEKEFSGDSVVGDGYEFSFTITGPHDYSEEITITDDGEFTLDNLVSGDYIVSEDTDDMPMNFTLDSDNDIQVTVIGDENTVVFTNSYDAPEEPDPLGSLTIEKVLTGDPEPAGTNNFIFQITHPDESITNETIDGAGTITLDELTLGTYLIEEVEADMPANFSLTSDNNLSVTLSEQNLDDSVSFTNDYDAPEEPDSLGSLTIEKVLTGDPEPAGTNNFIFQITHPDESITNETIDGAGTITLDELTLGTYLIEEVEADMPANFSLTSDNNLSVTLSEQNLDDSVSFTNDYDAPTEEPDPLGSLTIEKVLTGDPEPAGTNNFTFQITHPDESITNETIDGAGTITLDELALGTYLIEEVESEMPANFSLVSDNNLVVTLSEQNLEDSVAFTNDYDEPQEPEEPEGSLIIEKEIFSEFYPDATNTFTFSIEGLEYSSTRTIDGEGEVTISGLAPGSYTVTETGMPEGFTAVAIVSGETLLEADSMTVDVVDDGTTRVIVRNVYNEPEEPEEPEGSLTIEKVLTGDPEPAGTNNFVFSITGTEFSDTVTIDGEGEETLSGLVPGNYTVTETSMPTNFSFVSIMANDDVITASQSVEITVVDNGERTVVFTNAYNEPEDNDEPVDDDDDEDEPNGPTTFIDLTTDEVEIEEPVPQAPALPKRPKVINPPDEEIVLDEPIPEAPAALPQTGELPPSLFYGLGSLLSLMGVTLKRKDR